MQSRYGSGDCSAPSHPAANPQPGTNPYNTPNKFEEHPTTSQRHPNGNPAASQ